MLQAAQSLQEALQHSISIFGDKDEAVRDGRIMLTRRELFEQACRLAGALCSEGVTDGDRVLVCANNSVEFVIAHFAVLVAGGVSVPLEANTSQRFFAHVSLTTRPKAIIATAPVLSTLYKNQCPLPSRVFCFGPPPAGLEVFDAKVSSRAGPYKEISERGGRDLAAILFTTGSTGLPKGVMLSHAATISSLKSIIDFVGYTPSDREVITMPISHSFGLGHLYCNLFAGGSVYLEPGLANVKRVLTAVSDWNATGFPGTPLGFSLLLDTFGPVFREMAKNLRFIVINSAPLPPSRAAQLQEALPNTEIFVYYGLTEASRSTYISFRREPTRLYSVGKPMRDVKVSVDPHTHEILISGPHLSSGYWEDPEQTAKSFTPHGLRTGDKGRLDEEGFLVITGRLKDEINVGGFKVDPNEVESHLRELTYLVDVGVVGLERGDNELVACAIVMKKGVRLDKNSLTQWARVGLETYKIPTVWRVVKDIPRSVTGKILRSDLKQMLINSPEGLDP